MGKKSKAKASGGGKLCGTCDEKLPKANFAPEQWRAQSQTGRRCKECTSAIKDEIENKIKALMAEAITEEDLSKQPPPRDECPICRCPLSFFDDECIYLACCGKLVCGDCGERMITCPFCSKEQFYEDEEEGISTQLEERVKSNDSQAMVVLGNSYKCGDFGLPKDKLKAQQWWARAAVLGNARGLFKLAYDIGNTDADSSLHLFKLAAIKGSFDARWELADYEIRAGRYQKASHHCMMGACAGHEECMDLVREFRAGGFITEDEYENTVRAHKESLSLTKIYA